MAKPLTNWSKTSPLSQYWQGLKILTAGIRLSDMTVKLNNITVKLNSIDVYQYPSVNNTNYTKAAVNKTGWATA